MPLPKYLSLARNKSSEHQRERRSSNERASERARERGGGRQRELRGARNLPEAPAETTQAYNSKGGSGGLHFIEAIFRILLCCRRCVVSLATGPTAGERLPLVWHRSYPSGYPVHPLLDCRPPQSAAAASCSVRANQRFVAACARKYPIYYGMKEPPPRSRTFAL